MGGDARSDLQALQRSGRTKVAALALVMMGALAAAAWFLIFEPHGEGAPERSDKVLIVRGTEIAGYSSALGRMGFDAAEGSLPHWEDKTHAELPDFEGTAVQGVVALADHFGYGFVAFEHPQTVDFTGLEFEDLPAFDEHVRFAVLSIGDFALPHRVTTNAPVPTALRRHAYPLVEALFLQDELARTLPGSEVNDIDVLQRRSQLERAITMLELRRTTDALAATVEEGWSEALRDSAGVSVVGARGLETAFAQPLPDGRLFAAVESFEVVTRDGVRADLERAERQDLVATAGREETRTRCMSFSGGSLDRSARFSFSPRARSLVVHEKGVSSLWQWRGEDAPCGYTSAGTFDTDLVSEMLAVQEGGHVAFVRRNAAGAELWVGTNDTTGPGTPRRIARLGDVVATDPVWLDAQHVALASRADGQPATLHIFEGTPRGARFQVGLAGLPPEVRTVTLAGPSALLLTVADADTPGDADAAVWRLEAPLPWAELLVSEASAEDDAPTVQLSAEGWQLRALTHGGHARDVTVSPDGTRAAFVWSGDGGPGEIVVTDAVNSSPLLELTADRFEERAPRFDAAGTRLVFQTRRGVPKTGWTVSIPRSVAVPGA